MKKILLATSILVGTAGIAAADVNISGGARFGVIYNGATWSLTNRFTLNFDGSGETDGGLAYGGRVRLRASNFGAAALSGSNAWIESNGFRLTVGNVNGAIEVMPGLYANGVGLTGLGWHGVVTNYTGSYWGWQAFSSAGAGLQGVAIDYSMGDFAIHASWGQNSASAATLGIVGGAPAVIPAVAAGATTQIAALSGSYNFGSWTVGLGAQADLLNAAATMQDFVVANVSGSFGDFGVNAQYASFMSGAVSKWVIGGSYSMNDIGVNAYYGEESGGNSSYGIGATYDLGGATIAGGINGLTVGGVTTNTADLGIRVSF